MKLLLSIWLVITNKAIIVPIPEEVDTCIAVVTLEENCVESIKILSFVEDPDSYCVQLSRILYWVVKRKRFFWKSDSVGAAVDKLSKAERQQH